MVHALKSRISTAMTSCLMKTNFFVIIQFYRLLSPKFLCKAKRFPNPPNNFLTKRTKDDTVNAEIEKGSVLRDSWKTSPSYDSHQVVEACTSVLVRSSNFIVFIVFSQHVIDISLFDIALCSTCNQPVCDWIFVGSDIATTTVVDYVYVEIFNVLVLFFNAKMTCNFYVE